MATKAKPGDATGRLREETLRAVAAEQEQRSASLTMAAAEEKIRQETEIIDATVANTATVIVDEVIVAEAAKDDTVVIRVVEDIENMTFGAGNYFSFRAGQKYAVNRDLANHLQAKGYLVNTL